MNNYDIIFAMKGFTVMFKRIASTLLLSAMLFCTSCADSGLSGDELRALTVATSENFTVSDAVVTYFYNDTKTAFFGTYASVLDKLGLDPSLPLEEQPRKNGNGTWYDYFISTTTTVTHYLITLNELAMDEGITLSDAETAAIQESAKATAKNAYGKGISHDDIAEARCIEALAYKYENTKKAELMPTIEDMEAYIAEKKSDFKYDESATVNVRHILISDAASNNHDAAVKKANELLAAFTAGDMTTDAFNLLVLANSNDPGSVYTGGLYKNLAADSTVKEFNDWCFDPDRKPGDTAVIETEYGAHVMLFDGEGLPAWQAEISDEMVSERLSELRSERFENFPVTFDDEAVKLIK